MRAAPTACPVPPDRRCRRPRGRVSCRIPVLLSIFRPYSPLGSFPGGRAAGASETFPCRGCKAASGAPRCCARRIGPQRRYAEPGVPTLNKYCGADKPCPRRVTVYLCMPHARFNPERYLKNPANAAACPHNKAPTAPSPRPASACCAPPTKKKTACHPR